MMRSNRRVGRSLRWRLVAAATSILSMTSIIIVAGQEPAAAGDWAFGHGWGGEGTIIGDGFYGRRCNCEWSGDVVGLWKSILNTHYGSPETNSCYFQPTPVWYGNE